MEKYAVKIIIVVLLFTTLISGLLIFCFLKTKNADSINEPIQSERARDEDEKIPKNAIVFEADTAHPTKEQMNTIVDIMYKRLMRMGFTEANVKIVGTNKVFVDIPSVTNPDEAIKELGKTAKLSFVDSEGKEILTGKDVKDAKAMYGQINQNSGPQHYVELTLNSDAQARFFEATTRMSQKPDGENYISINLDDEEYSKPSVHEPINDNKCIISGNFTADTAKELATTIKEGQLPFKLNVVEKRN